jgi:hypothetical protein
METVKGVASYVIGTGLIPQILFTIVFMIVLWSVVGIVETVVDAFKRYDRTAVTLLPDTYTGPQEIVQSADGEDPLVYPSINEVNGMEFSYSFHLFLNPDTFAPLTTESSQCGDTTTTVKKPTALRHVWSKGNKRAWPLLAPGVFMHGNKNTMRIYMNSVTDWNKYVDIPNIPIGKWFHCVITMKGTFMDVYINGNVIARSEFKTVPRINFGSIRVFQDIKFPRGTSPTHIGNIVIDGSAKGMISRFKYFAFAVNYSQIDVLYREEASKHIVTNNDFSQKPPYLHDGWWVTKY